MSKKKHAPYIAFKRAIAGKGLTYKDVAKVIGVTESTLMLKINGKSDFYLSEQRTICSTFDIDQNIFFENVVAYDNKAINSDPSVGRR